MVRLVPLAESRVTATPVAYARVVRAAFAQRRKTLGNALKGIVGRETFVALGIDPRRRGETLSIEEFDRIARSLA